MDGGERIGVSGDYGGGGGVWEREWWQEIVIEGFKAGGGGGGGFGRCGTNVIFSEGGKK